MHLGILHTTIRLDEKLLGEACEKAKVKWEFVDVRDLILEPNRFKNKFDVVIERCISTTLGTHAVNFFHTLGVKTVNTPDIATVCSDKFLTSLVLEKKKVPTVPFAMAFTEETALEAVEMLGGYPVVIKPSSGSWGRLIAKINDKDALEAVIEQKMVLGSPSQKPLYIQKFIEKPGRDIRVTMAGGEVICAIYRETSHWISNTARGAQAKPCKVDDDLNKICVKASKAVGGGILGVDVFESDQGYIINEINHTTEFKNVQAVTGVDVAGAMVKYCKGLLK